MTDEARAIQLPSELRPADGRFGSGPSRVRPEALAALAVTGTSYLGTSHRRPAVKSVVRRLREGLCHLFRLPGGYEIVLGNGGTTLFWDAATCCLIERRSAHYVFGEFSGKFAAAVAAAPFLEPPDVIESAPGTHPAHAPSVDADAYALTHNETSTGVTMDVRRPSDGLVLVDATSAAGGLRVDPRQFDVYYFAPQKCFASDGGLFVAICSPAAVDRIGRAQARDRWIPPMLDLSVALENSRLDQTYNTPALATLFLFVHQLEWMLAEGGLDAMAKRCDRSAEIIYGWAERRSFATPFVVDPGQRSHTVATIDFDQSVSADTVAGVLRRNGVIDTESYRKLGRNQLRIALFPAIDPGDVEQLTAAIDYVVESLT